MLHRLRFGRRPAAVKHVCRECEARRALFRYRGIVKWNGYHTLCFQCYRRHVNRQRAAALAAGIPAPPQTAEENRAAVA